MLTIIAVMAICLGFLDLTGPIFYIHMVHCYTNIPQRITPCPYEPGKTSRKAQQWLVHTVHFHLQWSAINIQLWITQCIK